MHNSSQRDAEKILSILKEVNDQVITTEGCYITFPVRFELSGLATIGSDTNFYGLFKISNLDNTYHAVNNVSAFIHSEPDSVVIEKYKDEPYYILQYDPGSVVIKNTNLLQNRYIIGKIYKELIDSGRIPYYLNYHDVMKIFDTAKEYSSVDVGDSFESLAVPISIIARNPNDLNQYYREILDEVDIDKVSPAYIPSSSVYFAASSALTKITGSYFYTGVVSAINNPTDNTEVIDYILRY